MSKRVFLIMQRTVNPDGTFGPKTAISDDAGQVMSWLTEDAADQKISLLRTRHPDREFTTFSVAAQPVK